MVRAMRSEQLRLAFSAPQHAQNEFAFYPANYSDQPKQLFLKVL